MAKETKKTSVKDADIAKKLAVMAQDAVGVSAQNIANNFEEALRRYQREAFDNDDKIKGRSKYVGPEITTNVDWSVANVFRVFMSMRYPVSFQPNTTDPRDVAIAEQMTTVLNNLLRDRNKHGALLLQWLKNGFMTGVSFATVRMTSIEEESLPQMIKGLTDEALVSFYEQEKAGKIKVVESGEPYDAEMPPLPPGTPPEMAEIAKAMLPKVRDIKIRRIKRTPDLCIDNLPVEDFIVSKDARICQKTGGIAAKLQGHRRIISRDDLIEQGFDEAKIAKIPMAVEKDEGISLQRSKVTDYDDGTNDVTDDVTVYEIYTKMNIDGERSRHYRFTLAGDLESNPILLEKQEVSKFYPYAPFVPFPIPNTLFGQSMVDRIGQEHNFLSKQMRFVFDNLAAHSNPIKVINPEVTNVDDVLNLYPGAVVRSADPNGGITYNQQQFTGGNAMGIIDAMQNRLEYSTGAGPNMMGLETGDIVAETATGASQRKNAGMTIMETICRWFAETGYSYLMKVIVDAFVTNPEEAQAYITRLTDKYTPIQIDDWDADMDVTANVAFGVMNKDFNAVALQNILLQQQQAQGMGLTGPQQIYNTLIKITENAGFTNVNDFYLDPSKQPPQPPAPQPPDPIAIQSQIAQQQLEMQKQDADRKHDLALAKLKVDDDFRRDELAQNLRIKEAEINGKYGVDIEIARINAEQAMRRNDVDLALSQQEAQNQAMGHLAAMQQPQQPAQPAPQE
jgi:hypothetical protein